MSLFKKVIGGLLLFIVLSYWLVPPIAGMMIEEESLNQNFDTQMLKSDQPKSIKLSGSEKTLHRAMNLDTYLSILGSTIWHFPGVLMDYLVLPTKYPRIERDSFGMFVDGSKVPIQETLKSLEDLNITSTAIRIYVTEKYVHSHRYKENLKLAKELKSRGYSIMLVLAQLHETFSSNLSIVLGKIIDDFGEYVDYYQVGEAINRDKWGVLNKDRFAKYVLAVCDAVSIYPTAKIIGPAVIDFEWYYTIYYLNLARDFIDIQGTLLYVDRDGKPENSRYGFDAVKKARFLKAVAPDKPLWITEVNWPIKDTGIYRPTSDKEAVTPKIYRDYMLRYLIGILADGNVERVYWWQLFAKGYGLIDHTTKKKFPAFKAYKQLVMLLADTQVLKKERLNHTFKYIFRNGNAILTIMWRDDNRVISAPKTLKCRSFDKTLETEGLITQVRSTPIVCGDRLSMEFINRVMK